MPPSLQPLSACCGVESVIIGTSEGPSYIICVRCHKETSAKQPTPFIGHDPANSKDYGATVFGRRSANGDMVIDKVIHEPPKEEYVPMVGDKVSVEGVVTKVYASDKSFVIAIGDFDCWIETDEARKTVTLLSRPTPKRKITRKELEALVGSEFDIVD